MGLRTNPPDTIIPRTPSPLDNISGSPSKACWILTNENLFHDADR